MTVFIKKNNVLTRSDSNSLALHKSISIVLLGEMMKGGSMVEGRREYVGGIYLFNFNNLFKLNVTIFLNFNMISDGNILRLLYFLF